MAHQAYHIICTTHERARWFDSPALARILIREMRGLHEKGNVDSLAWGLMPDHLHRLLVLQTEQNLSTVIKLLKGRSARLINTHLQRTGQIWQKGFYDHALRVEEDLPAIARYIMANPIRAGLVHCVGDYPWWDAVWLDRIKLQVGSSRPYRCS
ncbi:transposase [Deefgea piscis]|uniref:REP-associated tyrosine transposase n=1 Tax=Deefgea piscis TaxID=2739061 RepID=UPI001C7F1DFB|nr:transposase [Deefgea piscis]QZA80908.1 transposase [Deefgea piscis]